MRILFFIILCFVANVIHAQLPSVEWQHLYGGTHDEWSNAIEQTSDGGFIVGGITDSDDGEVTGNHGTEDFWILKLDSLGVLQWQKCMGGSNWDECNDVHQTRDGGYIAVGSAESDDGDVTEHKGLADYWIIKLDSIGNLIWKKDYGGSDSDIPNAILQTVDNGFITVGTTYSNDSDVTGNHGGADFWVVKTDSMGNLQWEKCFGDSTNNTGRDICQMTDGSYIVVGNNSNYAWGATNGSLLLKLDGSGNILSQKIFALDTAQVDSMKSVSAVVASGGNSIVVSGSCKFYGGGYPVFVFAEKLDSSWNSIWGTTNDFGFAGWDFLGGDIQPTLDGGFLITGLSNDNLWSSFYKITNTGTFDWNSGIISMDAYNRAKVKQLSDGSYIYSNADQDSLLRFDLLVVKYGYGGTSIADSSWSSQYLTAIFSAANMLSISFISPGSFINNIIVTNVVGQTIIQTTKKSSVGLNRMGIETGNLSRGIYIVTLNTRDRKESVKVIKD